MSLELATALHKLGKPRILVVGDAMTDTDMACAITRFAQESPSVPVWEVVGMTSRPGGAAAVDTMVRGLGAESMLLSARNGAIKTRWFADGILQIGRTDAPAAPMTTQDEARIVSVIADEARRADCVLIADYGKGVCTDAVLRGAIDVAKERGIPVIVDPAHGADWKRYAGATCIKCNETEWGHWCSICRDFDDRERHSPWHVIVTTGAKGLRHWAGKFTTDYRCPPRRCIDVTGCGDSVLASLGVCVASGMDWSDACRVANAAAGLKVERRGAVPVNRSEVILDLCHPHKIIPADFLPHVKALSKRVVFTNGVFRVPTAAHAWVMQQAKAHGDILVVGVNSDESAAEAKPGEFVLPFEERAALLESMSAVDWVVGFDGDSPAELLDLLKPAVLVKGYDQTPEPFDGKLITLPASPFEQHVTGLVADICGVGK